MTGHVSFGPPPQTVPVLPAYIPVDVDMTMIKAQVAATGVSAPPAAMPGLLEVVNQAHADGINLKIVLLDHNPPNDTPLRDISTVVGADYHDATVLTLSPNYVAATARSSRASPSRPARTSPRRATRWSRRNISCTSSTRPSFPGPA